MITTTRQLTSLTIVLLLIATTAWSTAGAAQQDAPSQQEIDSLTRDVLSDVWTLPDFARRASIQDLTATHHNVRADLVPLNVLLTAAGLPDIPGVGFTLLSYEDAVALAARTGKRVSFIDIGLLTLTSTEATIRLGTDFVEPPESGMIKLCCCSRIAYYAKQRDRWIFRAWGAGRCG
jgi:hypothetical protein